MSTYYGDYPDLVTKDMLVREIRAIFDCGVASFNLFGPDTPLQKAKVRVLAEVFEHVMEWRFPNLDELRSGGALQDYLKEIENTKGKKHDGEE